MSRSVSDGDTTSTVRYEILTPSASSGLPDYPRLIHLLSDLLEPDPARRLADSALASLRLEALVEGSVILQGVNAVTALMTIPFTYDYPELKAAARYEAARAYVELNQPDMARKQLEAVMQEFPGTPWAEAAKERLATIKPK